MVCLRQKNIRTGERVKACSSTLAICVQPSYGTASSRSPSKRGLSYSMRYSFRTYTMALLFLCSYVFDIMFSCLKNVLLALLVLSKTFSNFASNNNASSLWQIILYGRTTTGCC